MRLLLLLFPALVSSVYVEMSGKAYFDQKYIYGVYNVRSFDQRPATDNDRVVFHLLDQELEAAIEHYFGKKPDHIIFTRDSSWDDVYGKNQWTPVEVKLQADTPELVELTTENVVLAKSVYENPSKTLPRKVNMTESGTTYDSVTSVWSNPRELEGNDVNIRFHIEAEDEFHRFEHTFAFGRRRRTLSKNFRTQTGSVELPPSGKVLVQLEAKKGTLRIIVPYTASISGTVAVHYKPDFKNSEFHGLDVKNILDASVRNTTYTAYQSISYEFYYGQTLKILNATDGYTVIESFAPEVKKSSGNRRKATVANHAVTGKKIMINPGTKPFAITEEELKAIVDQIIENEHDEESSESTERVENA